MQEKFEEVKTTIFKRIWMWRIRLILSMANVLSGCLVAIFALGEFRTALSWSIVIWAFIATALFLFSSFEG